jgi:hypothetical protein
MRVRLGASLVLTAAVAAAGCGGGGSSTPLREPALPTTTPPPLSASPTALLLNRVPTLLLVTGLRGTPSIAVADPLLVDVSPPVINGSAVSFTLAEAAGGSTTVTVTDGGGGSVTVPITTTLCLPPAPNLTLIGEAIAIATPSPPPGQPQFRFAYTTLFFSTPSLLANIALAYKTRLIGSDGSIAYGSPLEPISQVGTATSASPPPAPAGTTESFSAAPALGRGLTYRVQIIGQGCEPPVIVGSFST